MLLPLGASILAPAALGYSAPRSSRLRRSTLPPPRLQILDPSLLKRSDKSKQQQQQQEQERDHNVNNNKM